MPLLVLVGEPRTTEYVPGPRSRPEEGFITMTRNG